MSSECPKVRPAHATCAFAEIQEREGDSRRGRGPGTLPPAAVSPPLPRPEFTHTTLGYMEGAVVTFLSIPREAATCWITMPDPDTDERAEHGRHGATPFAQIILHAAAAVPSPGHGRRVCLGFAAEMVERALARTGDRRRHCPGERLELPLESAPVAAIHSFTRWVAQELERPDRSAVFSGVFMASLEHTLLALFLDCLSTAAPAAPPAPRDLTPAQLERIDVWIAEHAQEQIGVKDIAAAAGVSIKAPQNGFRRQRDCSPKEALLRHRLEEARRALASPAKHGATSVTQVALDCGFQHLGRFARSYARAFGEKPSDTLAGARALSAGSASPEDGLPRP